MNSDSSLLNPQKECIPKDTIPVKKKRAVFTKEEDKRLIKAVQDYGEGNWSLIASYVGNRTKRQCSERWRKFLCPTVNLSKWTQEEDNLLLMKFIELGPKWTLISKFFDNRTDVNVKARYVILNRKMKKRQEFLEKVKLFTSASTKSKSGQKKLSNISNINFDMKTNNLSQNFTEISNNFIISNEQKFEVDEIINNQYTNNVDSSPDVNLKIQYNNDETTQTAENENSKMTQNHQNTQNIQNSFFDLNFTDIANYYSIDLWKNTTNNEELPYEDDVYF